LLISKWYMPHESQTRIAIFFTASAIAGAFSGLLAFAISKMDGVGGYEGWRWVWLLGYCLDNADTKSCRSSSLKESPLS
jgi:MFS family permease